MSWKRDLDALVESTVEFVNEVKPRAIPEMTVAMRAAEQALAQTRKPIPSVTTGLTPPALPTSERDEIRQRVSNFKAHQQKFAREREQYYLEMKAKMMAPPAFIYCKKASPPGASATKTS